MAKLTFTSLFSGIGGCDLGAIAAGFEVCESLEFDPQIAELHKANIGGRCHVTDILDADPFKFEKVDVLHASPVCKSFSTANANKGERQLDIDCALKVAEFIEVLQPPIFTLENVQAYAKSKSFGLIVNKLYSLGYWLDYQVLNAADFGVPQSRRRLILIANRNGFVPPPPPKERHIGWYEAIADKVHDLPDSKLADWQIKALPREIREHLLLNVRASKGSIIGIDPKGALSPSHTIPASVTKEMPKALLIENTGARSDRPLQTRLEFEPSWTIRAMGQDGHYHRASALLLSNGNSSSFKPKPSTEPAFTLTSNHGGENVKALLIHPTDQRTMPVIEPSEPSFTLTSNQGGNHVKALLEGIKIKALDIACLARLQSFPDDYKWSGKKSLDGKGIGNSVPPLMYEKILKTTLPYI